MYQWRRFQFFDKELLLEEDGKEPMLLFQEFEPTCSSSGRGNIIFGDSKGRIRILNRDFEQQTWQAHEGGSVIALHQLKRQHILISLGGQRQGARTEEGTLAETIVKIWKLDMTDGQDNPVCARAIKIFSSKFPQVPATCLSALEDLSQIAIGLSTGSVMIFDGDLIRHRTLKQYLLETAADGSPVTGVHYREDEARNAYSLFVLTPNEVLTFYTKARTTSMVQVDAVGCAAKCAVINEDKGLVVARPEAVYFYEPEEKGICFGFDGEKVLVGWFNNYLYLVTDSGKAQKPHTLTIYDIKNKFIAHAGKFDKILNVVSEWGSIFVLTRKTPKDGREVTECFQLSEKDRTTKMELLFRKNVYSIAISLAESQKKKDADSSYVKDIYQMYGDHLYSKGDYDGAIAQYLQTINYVEPSYVIRKFLDAQRIHNLKPYLEALHKEEQANSEHTTLLLNCYTKLKDVHKLDDFIKNTKLKFDVETAIKVCRQSGYYEHALFLARKHEQHGLYLKIQLADEGNYQEALNYIWSLSFKDAEHYTKEYGHCLVAQLPEDTTRLIKQLCAGYRPRPLDKVAGVQNLVPAEILKAKAEDFIHFYVGNPEFLQEFLEYVEKEVKCTPVMFNTLLELYLSQGSVVEQEREVRGEKREKEGAWGGGMSQGVMKLLKSHADYDLHYALVLTKLYNFERGVLFLLGKLQLYHEIIQHHMDRGRHANVLKACKKHGDQDKQLWVSALCYFAEKKDKCEDEIIQVLDNIEKLNLLPPLRVVQILSQNETKPLSVVKDYIIRTLQKENAIIAADQREIGRYQDETTAMQTKIHDLKTKPTTFQGIKCHHCSNPLTLPATHFLCMHSFHQTCIVDNDRECPLCAEEFKRVEGIRESQKASASQHNQFMKQLDDGGFETVAEYFGKGIFDKTQQ